MSTATASKRKAAARAPRSLTFEELVRELNLATTGQETVARTGGRRRHYVDWLPSPRDPRRQQEVSDELCRRICRGEKPLTSSDTLVWEIITAIDPDSNAASRLVNHLITRRSATFDGVHTMLDYCAAYWPEGHRLTGLMLDRLENLAATDEARGALRLIRSSYGF